MTHKEKTPDLKMSKRVLYDVRDGRDELQRLYDADEERFRKSYLSDIEKATQEQMAARLVISSHSMEKGLSNDNYEIGHGFSVVRRIVGFLEIYKNKGYDTSHLAYINTLSVLKVFRDRHKDTKHAQETEAILGDWIVDIDACTSTIGGAYTFLVDSKEDNDSKNFKDLAMGRFAVRSYGDQPVDKKDIEEAVEIALKSPTVCNRQSVRVRVMYDENVIAKVLEVQEGIVHYKTPPVLILITADDNSYVGVNERNQGYVDGGLFAMSLLYALEYKKIAACPLHAMFEVERDLIMRGLLNIPDNEKFITFISAGHFKDDNNVCKSFRYPLEDILREENTLHEYRIETVTPQEITPNQASLLSRIKSTIRIRTRLRSLKQKTRIRTRYRQAVAARADKKRQSEIVKNSDGVILTLTGYFNYGNIVQRYALQEFLRQRGYTFLSYAREQMETDDKRFQYTADFVKRNIDRKPFNKDDKFPVYIVGSDQVWRNWHMPEDQGDIFYYFYDFLGDSQAKRISYAASFGVDSLEGAEIDDELSAQLKPLAQKFDAVSMREHAGVEIAKEAWGIDAELVIDPTMLLDKAQYSRLIEDSPEELSATAKVFAYILAMSDQKKGFVDRLAGEYDADMIHPKELGVLPPVEQWLKGFRDAELVITDSFHGTVFAIINNTPFVVIENKYGGVARITTLLEMFDLEDRVVSEGDVDVLDIDSLSSIDWAKVNKRLKRLQDKSGGWLIKAIGGSRE